MFRWLGPIALAAFLYGVFELWSTRAIEHPPGVLAAEEPRQRMLDQPPALFERAGWRVKPVAEFAATVRVLGAERYRWDATAALAPIDLAVGWGPMSDSRVIERIGVFQNTRYWHWSWKGAPPIPPEEIVRNASNMHMIPATADIERRLKSLRRGHVVSFSGYLVAAQPLAGGPYWSSSTSRTDTGNGACEIVWVTELSVR
jgi:hypothetical protein